MDEYRIPGTLTPRGALDFIAAHDGTWNISPEGLSRALRESPEIQAQASRYLRKLSESEEICGHQFPGSIHS